MHWRSKWQPTPVFLPAESHGQGNLVGCCLWGRTESDMTEATKQQQQILWIPKQGYEISVELTTSSDLSKCTKIHGTNVRMANILTAQYPFEKNIKPLASGNLLPGLVTGERGHLSKKHERPPDSQLGNPEFCKSQAKVTETLQNVG